MHGEQPALSDYAIIPAAFSSMREEPRYPISGKGETIPREKRFITSRYSQRIYSSFLLFRYAERALRIENNSRARRRICLL